MIAKPLKRPHTNTPDAAAVGCLKRLAPNYMWWKTPDEALRFPNRLIAQIMDIGTFEDIRSLFQHVGAARLADVVRHAEIGWFRPKSWSYWHYRLGLTKTCEPPPPMPKRTLG